MTLDIAHYYPGNNSILKSKRPALVSISSSSQMHEFISRKSYITEHGERFSLVFEDEQSQQKWALNAIEANRFKERSLLKSQ